MIEFLTDNWEGLTSTIGLLLTLAGLIWAIIEARRARSASQQAREAARETTERIARHFQTVDLTRAVGLIQRIKLLHDIGRWEAATEHYQPLRDMLSDVIARCPEGETALCEKLTIARVLLMDMEGSVGERINQGIEDSERVEFNRQLNEIQSYLEELASALGFGDSQEEAK